MDRISALRNVEDALADFEAGDASLGDVEDRVLGVLRTYATEFDEGDVSAYRATGDPRVEGTVVVAESEEEARERVAARVDEVPEFRVEPVG
ncbi:hypothetical protein [Halobacterium sp. R2-5]|uniref:DUF7854 family protein n=1 Tax=Halobacterium sp. R2-5 TaxID=2715751 RepID=UPI001421A2DE|nr:hypothetical protein [Halobacterium sp. R2-5]NIB98009.1 hypothetical protein [Halobacterium sp. R2-5]